MSPAAFGALLSSTFPSSLLPPSPSKRNNLSFSIHSHTPVLTSTTSFLELGFSDKQTHLLFHNHPQLHSIPLEPLQHRITKLRSLKLTNPTIQRAISRRPHILTSPEIDPFLDFILREITGLNSTKLELILVSSPLHLFTEFSDRIRLLLDNGIPKENLGHIVNNVSVRKLFGEMTLRELDEMIAYLLEFGWPDIVIRRPFILNLDFETQLIPRVECLIDLAGGDRAGAAFIIRKLPQVLAYTVKHVESHLQCFASVGLDRERFYKIATIYPNVFSVSRERKLKPRIEFLMQCNLNAEDIYNFLIKAPTFLSLSYEKNLAKKLAMLVKVGFKHRTREMAFGVRSTTRTSCENMQLVIGLFLSYGFSCEDLLIMSRKHPQMLQYKYDALEKKMEFLIDEMEREIGELMAFPAFLGYKLDDRIKHRYETKKSSRGKKMSINKLLSVSTERFNKKK